MQIITDKFIDRETDAYNFNKMHEIAKSPLSCTFDDIKYYRDQGLAPGRLMAVIPMEVYLFIQHWAPEILKKKNLFNVWLSKHREYAIR